MKFFSLILLGMLTVGSSIAQVTHSVSFGPDLGIPTETLGKSKLGLGGSVEYSVLFNGKIGPQLHVGYQGFTNKIYPDQKVTFLPVRLGAAWFIYEDIFFISADGGMSRYYSPTTKTSQTGFSFGAGFGYRTEINGGQFVQVSVYFNQHQYKDDDPFVQEYNYNWFNLRVAYGVRWGKARSTK